VTAPLGAFKHLNHMSFPGHHKPVFVDQGMSPPEWWKHTELMSVFDKIMIDKVCMPTSLDRCSSADGQHKKPSMIQRLTRMGVNRAEAQLSVGEQVAKVMMRRRARMSISHIPLQHIDW